MGRLTAHFKEEEFACKDGTAVPPEYRGNLGYIVRAAEVIRAEWNAPMIIVSGYRTEEYNKRCGGAPKSQHLTASAMDIRIKASNGQYVDPQNVAKSIEDLIARGALLDGGIGTYESFVHYDVRTIHGAPPARWRG